MNKNQKVEHAIYILKAKLFSEGIYDRIKQKFSLFLFTRRRLGGSEIFIKQNQISDSVKSQLVIV